MNQAQRLYAVKRVALLAKEEIAKLRQKFIINDGKVKLFKNCWMFASVKDAFDFSGFQEKEAIDKKFNLLSSAITTAERSALSCWMIPKKLSRRSVISRRLFQRLSRSSCR